MSSVKSIETEYAGTLYRSRTEARWALLFDLASIDFQYEPEGYKVHSGWYVPDFWLRSWGCFFEVKPESVVIAAGYYCQERSLAEDLAMMTGHDVIFGCGNPHVMMKLAIVPEDGIPPLEEWLTDRIRAHWVSKATAFRFDWKRRAAPQRGGDIYPWGLLDMESWNILKDANRNRKRDG